MIGIVDYNAGNITSVARSLESLGIDYVLSKNPSDLADCDKLIFPGVGDAAYAMEQLKQTGFDDFLKKWAADGKAILGICLGSQIIFDFSEEGDTECLGLIKGCIRHFESVASGDLTEFRFARETRIFASQKTAKLEQANAHLKVPHMGWNSLSLANGGTFLLDGVPENSDFYFVHSYVICPDDSTVIKATADYGIEVPAIVQSGNVMACQFHPEKSGAIGMKILKNFCAAPATMPNGTNLALFGDAINRESNKSGEV